MGVVQKISIALTEELAGEIDAAVASGDYATASEVVRDALRLWKRERGSAIEELRALWKEGIESGNPRPLDVDAIIEEGRRRLAAGK